MPQFFRARVQAVRLWAACWAPVPNLGALRVDCAGRPAPLLDANGDVIDRSAQACDCFGIEFPVTPGAASVRFLHRLPSGAVEEYCENVAPYALGLGPNQPICADGLDEDGLHELMVTPYDAPGCEAGDGEALASSIRSFAMAAPEPGMAVMAGVGVLGLVGISRRRASSRV